MGYRSSFFKAEDFADPAQEWVDFNGRLVVNCDYFAELANRKISKLEEFIKTEIADCRKLGNHPNHFNIPPEAMEGRIGGLELILAELAGAKPAPIE